MLLGYCGFDLCPQVSLLLPSRFHYGGGALLRDPEQSEIVIQLLKGLSTLQLPYDHTSPHLDTWDHSTLRLSGLWAGPPEDSSSSGTSSPMSIASPGKLIEEEPCVGLSVREWLGAEPSSDFSGRISYIGVLCGAWLALSPQCLHSSLVVCNTGNLCVMFSHKISTCSP